jgi:hypothetical protein
VQEADENCETLREAHTARNADLECQLAQFMQESVTQRQESDATSAAALDMSHAVQEQLQQARSESEALRAEVAEANEALAASAASVSAAQQEAQRLSGQIAAAAAERAAVSVPDTAETTFAAESIAIRSDSLLHSQHAEDQRRIQQLQKSAEDAAADAAGRIEQLSTEADHQRQRLQQMQGELAAAAADAFTLRASSQGHADAQEESNGREADLQQQLLDKEAALSAALSQVDQLKAS